MVRDYEQKDYALLLSWWKKWNFLEIPSEMLPPTGFIANEKVAAFLYKTDSKVAWFAWPVSDKDASSEERRESIREVIEKICERAAELGFHVVFMTTENKKFADRMPEMGFVPGDINVQQFFRRVGG